MNLSVEKLFSEKYELDISTKRIFGAELIGLGLGGLRVELFRGADWWQAKHSIQARQAVTPYEFIR